MRYGYAEADRRKAFTTLWQYAPMPGTLDILPAYAGDDFDPSVEYFLPSRPIQQAVTPQQRQRASIDPSAIGGAAADIYNIVGKIKGDVTSGRYATDGSQVANLGTGETEKKFPWALVGGIAALGVAGFVIYKVTR